MLLALAWHAGGQGFKSPWLHLFNNRKEINPITLLRVTSSIYQALQIIKYGENICEIGSCIGRTIYFVNLLGIKKIDTPICSLLQSYLLFNSLSNINFSFSGDSSIEKRIQL